MALQLQNNTQLGTLNSLDMQSVIDLINQGNTGQQGQGNLSYIEKIRQSYNPVPLTATPGSQVAAGPTRAQIIADAQGLTQGAFRDLQQGQLADITRNTEAGGASASALAALLAQEATAATSANVGKFVGDQILQGANINAQLEGIKSTERNTALQVDSSKQGQYLQLLSTLINDRTAQRGQNTQAQIAADNLAATRETNLADQRTRILIQQLSGQTSKALQDSVNATSRANTTDTLLSNESIASANNDTAITTAQISAGASEVNSPFGVPLKRKKSSKSSGKSSFPAGLPTGPKDSNTRYKNYTTKLR